MACVASIGECEKLVLQIRSFEMCREALLGDPSARAERERIGQQIRECEERLNALRALRTARVAPLPKRGVRFASDTISGRCRCEHLASDCVCGKKPTHIGRFVWNDAMAKKSLEDSFAALEKGNIIRLEVTDEWSFSELTHCSTTRPLSPPPAPSKRVVSSTRPLSPPPAPSKHVGSTTRPLAPSTMRVRIDGARVEMQFATKSRY